jgi:5-methylcytosine-specific restriction endonuclease McrA
MMMLLIHCKVCGKEKWDKPYRVKSGRAKFCSKKCHDIFQKGRPSGRIKTGVILTCHFCGKDFYRRKSMSHHKFCCRRCSDNGRDFNVRRGRDSNFWKGGIYPTNLLIRYSHEYKLWRQAVFERDNWACVWCGARTKKGTRVVLHADHIKPFSLYPELRFAIDNGRTLCKECHKKTDTYGGRCRVYRKKVVENL